MGIPAGISILLFRLLLLLAVTHFGIILVLTNGLICRTDNFAVVGKLFQPVCAPAGNSGYGKYGGVQFHRQAQHMVYKAGIEVYIDAYALIHLDRKSVV